MNNQHLKKESKFWNSLLGKLIRWLAFLPIAYFLTSLAKLIVLPVIPWVLFHEFRFTPSTVLLFILMALFGLPIAAGFLSGVFFIPIWCCSKIAPHPKVAAAIFLVLFVGFEISAYSSGFGDCPLWVAIPQIIIDLILVAGSLCVFTAKDAAEN
jgi:hypothetical protein